MRHVGVKCHDSSRLLSAKGKCVYIERKRQINRGNGCGKMLVNRSERYPGGYCTVL